MNWWEKERWAEFTAAVLAKLDETTIRLVAADWLDEQDCPKAANRAEIIRQQCNEQFMRFFRPGQYADAGFPEWGYGGTQGLAVIGGWPVWAVLLPHCFTRDRVRPVFQLAPLTTVSTVGMSASVTVLTHSEIFDPGAMEFERGPEDGEDGSFDPEESHGNRIRYGAEYRDHVINLSRQGINPHAYEYRGAGRLPAPIFDHLPARRHKAVNERTNRFSRQVAYDRLDKAAKAALDAAWLCGWKWSGRSVPKKGKQPEPHVYASCCFAMETKERYQTEGLDFEEDDDLPRILERIPSPGINPWKQIDRVLDYQIKFYGKQPREDELAVRKIDWNFS